MRYDTHDTIVARATAAGGSSRGIVRLSGHASRDLLSKMAGAELSNWPSAPKAIDLPVPVKLADRQCIVATKALVWPATRSFTRQPTVELHTIGSPPILQAIVRRAVESGARLAEPGEFTLRAFLAGRIDLTQAEAVLAVIDAQGDSHLKTALHQLAGGMAAPLADVRTDLIALLADIEAGLDFVDEDIEFVSAEQIASRIGGATEKVRQLQAQLASRASGEELPRVVLAGPPNAGKSSLFNALVERFADEKTKQQAIVSATPGATRDVLVATIQFAGLDFALCDTAGVDDAAVGASPDGQAQELSTAAHQSADLLVVCEAADVSDQALPVPSTSCLAVRTKCDLAGNWTDDQIATSATTGLGIDQLASRITDKLREASETQSALVVPHTTARCHHSLDAASASLASALQLTNSQAGDELVAAELRGALEHLGAVAGTVSNDDVLDQVFSRFCIGK